MKAGALVLAGSAVLFAAVATAQPPPRIERQPRVFCGGQGGRCCEPYQGSAGVIGPPHCNEGLGCNVATDRCEAPCGSPGQVCCDGPETLAAQGGPLYRDAAGNIVTRKPMCTDSVCSPATRRCVANCGKNAGDPCCGPQPQLAVASCINPALACKFDSNAQTSGVCQPCGGLGQGPCARPHGCDEGLEQVDGSCVCSPDQRKRAPVTAAAYCAHWPERRAHCFSLPGLERRHDIAGAGLGAQWALQRDEVCVESAFQVKDGTILVDVDNPRIWDGAAVVGAVRTAAGASFQAFDHLTTLSGGQGQASRGGFFAYDTSGPFASLDSTLTRIPSRFGEFGTGDAQAVIDLVTPGVRVGPAPVTATVGDVQSDGAPLPPVATFRLALNPDVLLVPVQVVAVFSDQLPGAADSFSRERALTVFDRAADYGLDKWRSLDGNGRVATITVPAPYVVLDGDARPAQAGSYLLPDDIWAQCGIQFRLVQYSRVKVPNEIAAPREGTHRLIQGAPLALLAELRQSPSFLDGPLTVMVAPWCSDVAGIDAPLGQWLIGTNVVCIRASSIAGGTTLAHEIGHAILNDNGHVDCTVAGVPDYLMCPAGGGPVISAEQCLKARSRLAGSSLLRFPPPR